jgi:hypothetical protein
MPAAATSRTRRACDNCASGRHDHTQHCAHVLAGAVAAVVCAALASLPPLQSSQCSSTHAHTTHSHAPALCCRCSSARAAMVQRLCDTRQPVESHTSRRTQHFTSSPPTHTHRLQRRRTATRVHGRFGVVVVVVVDDLHRLGVATRACTQ